MLLDAFLKLEEPKLEGESTDTVHAKEIEILSFEQSIVRGVQSGKAGDTSSKPRSEHSPVRLIKLLDKASPKLLEAACKGTLYNKATLSLCQPSGTTDTSSSQWKRIVYFEVTLEGVHIASVRVIGDPGLHFTPVSGDLGPVEEIELTYRKIKWLYKGGSGAANISGSWNLTTNATT